jgi:hypothetical protein
MFTMQAVGATVAGTVAQVMPPGHAMAVMAAASITVSLLLIRSFRRPDPVPSQTTPPVDLHVASERTVPA